MSESHPGRRLRVTVVTPSGSAYTEDAAGLVAPAYDGKVGILPGHAPFLALMGIGELRVAVREGVRKRLAVRGGVLEVVAGEVTVLTPECVAADAVDSNRVEKEIVALKASKPVGQQQRDAYESQMQWATARRQLLQEPVEP
jgi:F-type H+-transporting ATPase subunit epsilon